MGEWDWDLCMPIINAVGSVCLIFALLLVFSLALEPLTLSWVKTILLCVYIGTGTGYVAFVTVNPCGGSPIPAYYFGQVYGMASGLFLAPVLLILFWWRRRSAMTKLRMVEGALEERLKDGSVRLLDVAWLLSRPTDYVLQSRQALPADAFVSCDQAVYFLRTGRVAALSYKWLSRESPDLLSRDSSADDTAAVGFHFEAVRRFLNLQRVKRQAWTPLLLPGRGPIAALMWDFASLYQSVTGEERYHGRNSGDEYDMFKQGLAVMANLYASPRVLVLQHKRLPADGIIRVPYESSGWCQFESEVASLMTVGGVSVTRRTEQQALNTLTRS